jgi:hypothetical protein
VNIQGENQANFLRSRGRKVVAAGGVYWCDFNLGSRLMMAFPDHAAADPPSEEIASLLNTTNSLAARYPALRHPGLESGIYVVRDRDYRLESVHKHTRKRVRTGLAACEIRPVSLEELLHQGLRCNLDTQGRQGRFHPEFGTPRLWERVVRAAFDSPGVSVTGAFIEGQLASYILQCLDDGWVHKLYQNSRTDLMHQSPNHALSFSTITAALADPRVKAVCSGPKTLLCEDGLHDFKSRMGYQVEPVHVAVQFHPAIAPFATSAPALLALRALRRMRPDDTRLQRAAAFLSVAREGRQWRPTAVVPVAGVN